MKLYTVALSSIVTLGHGEQAYEDSVQRYPNGQPYGPATEFPPLFLTEGEAEAWLDTMPSPPCWSNYKVVALDVPGVKFVRET